MSIVLACVTLVVGTIYLLHELLEYVRRRDEAARAVQAEVPLRRLTGTSPLALVEDPREAGMVILHLAVGPEASRVQSGAMEWVARDLMGSEDPAALVVRGRWLARQALDPVATVEALTAILDGALDRRERAAFMDAVSEIAHAEGTPMGARRTLLRRLEDGLGILARETA